MKTFDKEELAAYMIARRRIDENGCWIWSLSTSSDGYGQVYINRENFSAHRVSAYLWLDIVIDSPKCVLHRCDVRRCFNPDHLFLGTQRDNVKDMIEKGRGVFIRNTKLTPVEVNEIRARIEKGERQRLIAESYGVDQTLISQIKRGLIWKEQILACTGSFI